MILTLLSQEICLEDYELKILIFIMSSGVFLRATVKYG